MTRLFLLLPVILFIGCTNMTPDRGRLSIVDIDLREKEQIEAFRFESMVPYMATTNVTVNQAQQLKTEALPLSFWQGILNGLSALKARIRIVSIEWNNK